jgi:phosphohistidine phosphatase
MKTDKRILTLVRHAKAVKYLDGTGDIDRPLHETGYVEAYAVAAKHFKLQQIPDLIITSPAVRAFSTALIFQRTLQVPLTRFLINEKLYEADLNDLYELVAELDDRFPSVMLVGHNPSFSMLASKYDTSINHVPTAGVVRFEFDVEKWRHSSYINAELRQFVHP